MSYFENYEFWENFKPTMTEQECDTSKNGHNFIPFKKVNHKCYTCGKTIPRRF